MQKRQWNMPIAHVCDDDIELEWRAGIIGPTFDIETVYNIIQPLDISLQDFGKHAFSYHKGNRISYYELEGLLNCEGKYDWLILEFDQHYYLRKKDYI